ncbi:hypothetical protein C2E23DRAFT_266154 [Lenzites betulinus]|nr:hypothetical protein C2E23DRAFT_266154 [Lenzites betulinus]
MVAPRPNSVASFRWRRKRCSTQAPLSLFYVAGPHDSLPIPCAIAILETGCTPTMLGSFCASWRSGLLAPRHASARDTYSPSRHSRTFAHCLFFHTFLSRRPSQNAAQARACVRGRAGSLQRTACCAYSEYVHHGWLTGAVRTRPACPACSASGVACRLHPRAQPVTGLWRGAARRAARTHGGRVVLHCWIAGRGWASTCIPPVLRHRESRSCRCLALSVPQRRRGLARSRIGFAWYIR